MINCRDITLEHKVIMTYISYTDVNLLSIIFKTGIMKKRLRENDVPLISGHYQQESKMNCKKM